MNILIRCDGSIDNGADHILKYLAFADKLKSLYRCPITFAMRKTESCSNTIKGKYPVLSPHIADENFNEQEWLYNLAKFVSPDIIILDEKSRLTSATITKIRQIKQIKVLVADIYEYEEKESFLDLGEYADK